MKIAINTIILFVVLLAGCHTHSNDTLECTVIKGATLFHGNGRVISNSIVVIKDGLIQSIGVADSDIHKGAQVFDFTGKYITPGFVDAHVHFGQTGFFDARPDALDITDSIDYYELQNDLRESHTRYYDTYLKSGVTAVYDLGGLPWTLELQHLVERDRNAPHISATGPLLTAISDSTKRQLISLSSPEIARDAVRQNIQLGDFLQRLDEIISAREEIMAANLQMIYLEGIPIAVSIDAGNPGTLHGISFFKEMEAMQRAGIAPSDILQMATRNGAMAMGRIDDFGTLEKGKLANLVVFDKDPSVNISNTRSIEYVMKGGALIRVSDPPNGRNLESRIIYDVPHPSNILDREMSYAIYLPPNYESHDLTYPVVYFLHGGGGSDTSKRHHRLIREFNFRNTLDEAITNHTIVPMIVVIPDAGMSYYMNNINGSYQYEDYFFEELIPHVEQRFRLKIGRSFCGIAGFSMGGFGALLYSMHHPEKFSACAAIGAAIRTDEEIMEMPDEQYLRRYKSAMGDAAERDLRLNDFWYSNSILYLAESMHEKDKGKVRYQFVVGDSDYIYKGNSQLHALMRDAKIPHEYRVVEGKHFEYFEGEFVNALKFISESFEE